MQRLQDVHADHEVGQLDLSGAEMRPGLMERIGIKVDEHDAGIVHDNLADLERVKAVGAGRHALVVDQDGLVARHAGRGRAQAEIERRVIERHAGLRRAGIDPGQQLLAVELDIDA